MQRLLTVLLAGLLAAGAVTGCSQEPGASSAAAPSADGSSSAAESSSAAGEADTSEQVNLVYYYWGTPQNDLASVNEALNEYLLEKMNTTVELKLIDGGTYDSKMALVMSGNEEYDLCFTSSWANNYYTNVANGAYVDMGPLLDAYPRHEGDGSPALLGCHHRQRQDLRRHQLPAVGRGLRLPRAGPACGQIRI